MPAGSIVATGQTIQPSQHNPALNDIAQALTNSATYTWVSANFFQNIGGTITIAGANSKVAIYDRTLPADPTHGWQIYSSGDTLRFYQATNAADRFTVSATGDAAFNGSITSGGQLVWNAGNFNPANYAPLAGATFTGLVQAPAYRVDMYFISSLGGGNPTITVDNNDALIYDRGANKFLFVINGAQVASIDSAGNIRCKGDVLFNQASV